MLGTRIVAPSTTCELSDRPLYAATVRVVRLLAAAIDQSVSPGCTVCATSAAAGAASASAAMGVASAVGAKRSKTVTSVVWTRLHQ